MLWHISAADTIIALLKPMTQHTTKPPVIYLHSHGNKFVNYSFRLGIFKVKRLIRKKLGFWNDPYGDIITLN